MIIARTRVWALAAVASFTATRSFSIGLAICAAVAIWPTERAGAADWPLRGSLAPPTRVAIRPACRLRQHEYRFWKQHQFARRLYFAQLDAGSGGGAVLLDHVAFGQDERRGLRRVHRLQHAMGPTRPWLGSCLQGYAWGQFLPYAAVGIAVGRFNYRQA